VTSAHRRWPLAGLLLLLVLLLAVPARADAGVLVASAEDCDAQTFERPFLPWLDPAHYVLAPDGTFSRRAAGWQLSGARVVADNEPYYVHGRDAPAALELPRGSSATSRAMCVGVLHPTLRLFARNTGSLLGTLRVDVLFEDASGDVHALPIGVIAAARGWHPTLPLPVLANLLPLLPDERTAIAFRFTPQGPGSSWRIDDVYVDPYAK
jgi:hypothetical protein